MNGFQKYCMKKCSYMEHEQKNLVHLLFESNIKLFSTNSEEKHDLTSHSCHKKHWFNAQNYTPQDKVPMIILFQTFNFVMFSSKGKYGPIYNTWQITRLVIFMG